MALKSLSSILILTFLVASSLFGVSTAFGGRKTLAPAEAPGPEAGYDFGFVPLDRNDPKMIELAKFAIDEYNKEHNTKLVYTSLFEAISTESAQGTTYGLVVAATDNTGLNDYSVKVLVDKEDDKKIIVFAENSPDKF
ncbi:hypothetical protein BUALT_Bualt03G0086300 [Buddleja alternifolia]|uniref:Cystatin domain-containing protein n=1 Tax=Buddleja alternifolia TaxID=168488 RepID=A0AAV6XTN8_9LAMI|nr:hypothetical protein BUALT_Bualt03G0086300 [Buddleja alternifolia]